MLARGTYSIVAADPERGEVGCAVQSRYFAVGAVVPWARAGVGAVATQAFGVAGYGPQILGLLEEGLAPHDAIERALAGDELRERRQLGVVTAAGASASFTGDECNEWAGDRQGEHYAAQGNILADEAVVIGMAQAFEAADGTLAERLMAALEAAEAAGGDRRGRQSAAVLVERAGAHEEREAIDTVVDLRVDDHPEPVVELRRLLAIHTTHRERARALTFYEREDYEGGIDVLRALLDREPEDALTLFDLACYESRDGRDDDALRHLELALAREPSLREAAAGDEDFAALREDPRWRALVG
jgi:uncharacterized Ntn-hydrolase superfamily protein